MCTVLIQGRLKLCSRCCARRHHHDSSTPTLKSVTTLDPPKRKLFPRRVLELIAVAAAAAAMVVSWNVDEKNQPCITVRRFLDFNIDTQASLRAKTHTVAPGVMNDEPRYPSPADYQGWLDGLQQHADRITAPGLSEQAHRAAHAARQFWAASNQANDEFSKEPILNPKQPPSLKTVAAAGREFDTNIAGLTHACPR